MKWRELYQTLRQAVEEAADTHRPAPPLDGNTVCVECGNPYPCDTQERLCVGLAECDELEGR